MTLISGMAARMVHDRHDRACRHTVTIAPFTGRDQYTDETFGAPVTYDADVIFRQQSVVNANGEQQGARGSIRLAFAADGTAPAVNDDDKLTLPDGTTPPIIAVQRDPGNPAISPTVIYF